MSRTTPKIAPSSGGSRLFMIPRPTRVSPQTASRLVNIRVNNIPTDTQTEETQTHGPSYVRHL